MEEVDDDDDDDDGEDEDDADDVEGGDEDMVLLRLRAIGEVRICVPPPAPSEPRPPTTVGWASERVGVEMLL